ncbi:MAG TPA: hypothetical protein VGO40_06465 [Longimicrobium sp.]|jgi:hypothetical protein|nr:hypothetical protein [Longimicrobium sp.]
MTSPTPARHTLVRAAALFAAMAAPPPPQDCGSFKLLQCVKLGVPRQATYCPLLHVFREHPDNVFVIKASYWMGR